MNCSTHHTQLIQLTECNRNNKTAGTEKQAKVSDVRPSTVAETRPCLPSWCAAPLIPRQLTVLITMMYYKRKSTNCLKRYAFLCRKLILLQYFSNYYVKPVPIRRSKRPSKEPPSLNYFLEAPRKVFGFCF